MTIRQRLYIALSLILLITMFIIGVFFYSVYNFNKIHLSQNHRYDQIRRVEKLKEFNNSFSWIVLDIITDYDKTNVVKERLHKADTLFKTLHLQKKQTIENSESLSEKENLELIFSYFEKMEKAITKELFSQVLVKKDASAFSLFTHTFDALSKQNRSALTSRNRVFAKAT